MHEQWEQELLGYPEERGVELVVLEELELELVDVGQCDSSL